MLYRSQFPCIRGRTVETHSPTLHYYLFNIIVYFIYTSKVRATTDHPAMPQTIENFLRSS